MRYKLMLVIFLSPLLGLSQENAKRFQLGFTFSPTLSWITSAENGLESSGAKIGYSYGVLGDFGFAKNYFFSTAFTLTSLNSQEEGSSGSIYKHKIQYIEIPLTLKLKSNPSGVGKFYGQFGLGTGIKVSAKTNTMLPDPATAPKAGNVNLVRLGLIAGGGTEWNIGRNLTAITGVTYNNGFTKTFEQYDSKNPFVTFHLGVFF